MSDLTYLCPQCRRPLAPITDNTFDSWHCNDGHGVGVTLTESWSHFQDDEIHAIWQAAKTAPKSSLKSPALGHPMVAVTFLVDDDEVEGNEGSSSRLVTIDVALDEQFLWFQVVDFENMPKDLPNPAPSADQVAKLEALRVQSVRAIAKDLAADDDASSLGYRFGSRAAAMLGMSGFFKKMSAAAATRLKGS